MPAIYLAHPEHGTHIAYTDREVNDCLENGWTIVEEKQPEPPAEAKPEAPEKPAFTVPVIPAGYVPEFADVFPKRGPGRPRKDR